MARITLVDFLKIFHRSLYIQAAWNHERMLALGFCSCLLPGLKKRLGTKSERSHFLKRNLAFFNTHPYMASLIVGATTKMEHEVLAEKSVSVNEIARFKNRLSHALGAVGDQLFWRQIKALCALVGFVVTLYFGLIGLVLFLALYNLPHLYVRIQGLVEGIQKGVNVHKSPLLKKSKSAIELFGRIGPALVGAAFVLVANLTLQEDIYSAATFLFSVVLMLLFLRWRTPVPIALLILLALGAGFGLVAF